MTKTIEVNGLTISFPILEGILRRKKGSLHAVQDVSFSIGKGQTLGLVGESGCGKSTLISLLMRLYDVDEGEILIDGRNLKTLNVPWYHHNITAIVS